MIPIISKYDLFSFLDLSLGSPDRVQKKEVQVSVSSAGIPDSSGLNQHSCPGTFMSPPKVSLLLSSYWCWWYTHLLSGRISRRKPHDLLIRSPEDSVKLKPGPLNSHKHQGMHLPKVGLSWRIGSFFLPLTILLSELKRSASSTSLPPALNETWVNNMMSSGCFLGPGAQIFWKLNPVPSRLKEKIHLQLNPISMLSQFSK